jgi:NAD(P)-dependent dehydrogenase (short-subunit alcohol dehydrogenase family)
MSDEDWQKVLAVNLSGAFFIAQAALDHMIERGTGRIISVSSVIGETGNIGQANYAASKSGLFGLTKSLAKEAIFQLNRAQRPFGDGVGVTVNAVTPGFIATDMLATIPDQVLARIRGQIPIGWLGRPEEIARVVCFLAADESAYITGQIWAVNGGLPVTTPAFTVNRLCGSGLQAIVSAAQAIWLGDADAAVAGGAESMSRGQYWLPGLGGASGCATA